MQIASDTSSGGNVAVFFAGEPREKFSQFFAWVLHFQYIVSNFGRVLPRSYPGKNFQVNEISLRHGRRRQVTMGNVVKREFQPYSPLNHGNNVSVVNCNGSGNGVI
jgi:hypothetical protein